MEEKKIDYKSLIGFVLIFVILMWMFYTTNPTPEELKKQTEKEKTDKNVVSATSTVVAEPIKADTTAFAVAKQGIFMMPANASKNIKINNELLSLTFDTKGGYLSEVTLPKYTTISKENKEKVSLIKNGNAFFNIQLFADNNQVYNTKDLVFEPKLTTEGDNKVVTMRLQSAENQYLEYRYVLKPNDYMLDFSIKSEGLKLSDKTQLEWQLKAFRHEKSIQYENRYTEVLFEYENGKDNYLGQGKEADDKADNVTYIAYKQHLFSSILLTDKAFKNADLASANLVNDTEKDTIYTKNFVTKIPLEVKNGSLDYTMNWYYGPSDYKILNNYNRNLDEVIPLGWGLFGWLNKFVFIPIFAFLVQFFPFGIAIILLTIAVKLILSPITYKSFVSQAKMKVLRPEIQEINERVKDPIKRQQETMALYSKAGVNPMAGCIPALLQLPVFYALFQFFPSVFDLRQKSFLWADDLSSYDVVFQLPFSIPLYGNHVSLFPILASIAIFFYMKMTTGDQAMTAPPQEGMPDMGKIMKMMLYISPVMMLIFFNNYASGLSLYNFISNLITIGILIIIKKYVIDENKIHAQIQENKQKPKKQSKFQQKMQILMEQAQEQQKQKQKQKQK